MDQRSQKSRLQIALPLAVLLMLATGVVKASDISDWRVIPIPGASDVRAQGINDARQIVGTYVLAADNSEHGFLRNRDGSITTIDDRTANATHVYGINNRGQIAGYSNAGGLNGFIRNPDGSSRTISFPSSNETFVFGINDAGQVIGIGDTPSGAHAFVKAPDSGFVTFAVPSGSTLPLGINNSGQIVGASADLPGTGDVHGFLRDTDGSFTMIDVPGAIFTEALGINALSQIVGVFGFIPDPTTGLIQNRGFIRDTDGTITTFDAPFFGSTQPNGISSTGLIVASFSRNPANGPPNQALVRSCILCP